MAEKVKKRGTAGGRKSAARPAGKATARKAVARKAPARKKPAPKKKKASGLTPEKEALRKQLEKQIATLSREVDKAEK